MDPTDFCEQDLSPVQREYLEYWRKKAAGRIAPLRGDLDVLDVPLLMPYVTYLDVEHDPLDFRHRLLGTAIAANFARDYTGMSMREIEGRGPGSDIWAILDAVRVGRKPALYAAPYVGPKKDYLRLNNLVLPVVDAAGDADMIILVGQFVTK